VRQQLLDHALDRRRRQHHAVMAREHRAGHAEQPAGGIGHRGTRQAGIQAAVEPDQLLDAPAAPGAPRPAHCPEVAEAGVHRTRRLATDGEHHVADARGGLGLRAAAAACRGR
jgi:hypothetical protein